MPSISRTGRGVAAAAAAALLLASAPSAMAATSSLTGSISPNTGPIGTALNLKIGFEIRPTADGEQPTLNRVTLMFPNNARPNNAIFPVCTEQTIDQNRGRFTRCARGSQIGTGRVMADVPNADVFNVPAKLTFFNGGPGKITMHVYATNPVLISEAVTTTIKRVGGRFGYKVDAPLPDILQEISDGWFAVEKTANISIGGTRMIRGRRRGFIETTTRCPSARRVPIQGTFNFRPGHGEGPTTADGSISCR